MSPEEANRVAPRWLGFAYMVSAGVRMPIGYSREDWRSEAFVGLALGLRGWRERPGYIDGAGAPARYLRRAIRAHLLKARKSALGPADSVRHNGNTPPGRPEFHRAERLERPWFIDDGESTLHDVIADPNSPDPHARAVASGMLDAIREAAPSMSAQQRAVLGLALRDYTTGETAEAMGITRQRVYQHTVKIRERLAPAFGLSA